MTLRPGWYLVGRHDGSVEPFYVKVTAGPEDSMVLGFNERWLDLLPDYGNYWWEKQAIPDCIPLHWPRKKAR